MHNAAFAALGLDYIYVPFNVKPDSLKAAVESIRALDIVGVNVTIPHKNSVGQYLDWVSDDAMLIGSVNTIHNVDGVLRGYSTDGIGFLRALEDSGMAPDGARAVVLGAGGAACATVYALAAHGSSVTVANRSSERAERLASCVNSALGLSAVTAVGLDSDVARNAVREADLLVNCTPVGMHPNVDAQPIPSEWLHSGLLVFDQVYNPSETKLLRAAGSIGSQCVNGAKMLVYQGAASFEIWTGLAPPVNIMEEAVSVTANA
jgi:shikimate dehydrogenase